LVQSLNTAAELAMEGTSFHGLNTYGTILVGDKGFEFYNAQRAADFIQIPWTEIEDVIASVLFHGKHIPRIAIRTKQAVTFSFAARHPKALLRAMHPHVKAGHMVRSLGLLDVLKRALCPERKKMI